MAGRRSRVVWVYASVVVAFSVVAGCVGALVGTVVGPNRDEERRLAKMRHESILTSPPAGFSAVGERRDRPGMIDLYGDRHGGHVTQSFVSDRGVGDATNAWADRLAAEGWRVRFEICPAAEGTSAVNFGTTGAVKTLDGLEVSATATTRRDGSARLELRSPDDGERTFRYPNLPPPQRC